MRTLYVCLLAGTVATAQEAVWVASFEKAWETVREKHFDAKLGGVDWEGARRELLPKVAAAKTEGEARGVLRELLGRLGHSHVGVIAREVYEKEGAGGIANLPSMPLRVEFARRAEKVGYLRLNVFFDPEGLARAMERAVEECRGCAGFVVDLRGNPGGLGGLAATLAGWFVDRACVLGKLQYRDLELTLAVNPRVAPFTARLAVLIDGKSASTAEFFAAGMQDLGRARIFGQKSMGAALPSMIDVLPSGDRLQYVIANYVSVGGGAIEGRGVVPDVAIEASGQQNQDPVLDAAMEWILRPGF
jgi:C-terminal processing protease CtpA/Prc